MSGALGVDVIVEAAFGSPPGAATPTWTDITPWVAWDVAPIRITPGRTAERDRLAPRRLELTLDNAPTNGAAQNAFDPRNTSGPFYGALTPRVPIRVRIRQHPNTWTIFRGFLDGAWPQELHEPLQRFVKISALDALGFCAQTPPPATAFHAVVEQQIRDGRQPRFWLRSCPHGWIDHLTGRQIDATCAMDQVDAVVDGDPQAFAPVGVDGAGVATDPTFRVVPSSASGGIELLFTCWVRLNPAWNSADLWQELDNSGNVTFQIVLAPTNLRFDAANSHGSISEGGTMTGDELTVDWGPTPGTSQHIALWVRLPGPGATPGSARLWVDGVERTVAWTDSLTGAGTTTALSVSGPVRQSTGSPPRLLNATVDHAVAWWDIGSWGTAAIEQLVRDLHAAGRFARVGDRLDERLAWLLDAVSWAAVGPLTAATVTTRQAFRADGAVIDLVQQIEDSEQGLVWVDNDGRMRFWSRDWAWDNNAGSAIQATFSDNPSGSEIPIVPDGTVIVDDDRRLSNIVRVTRRFGREQTVEDTASINAFGRRASVDINNLLLSTDREARAIADWLLLATKDPQLRVERLVFSPPMHPTVAVQKACTLHPGRKVRLRRNGIDLDGHIVAVGHDIAFDSWRVELLIDATRARFAWARWGTSTWGGTTPWGF